MLDALDEQQAVEIRAANHALKSSGGCHTGWSGIGWASSSFLQYWLLLLLRRRLLMQQLSLARHRLLHGVAQSFLRQSIETIGRATLGAPKVERVKVIVRNLHWIFSCSNVAADRGSSALFMFMAMRKLDSFVTPKKKASTA